MKGKIEVFDPTNRPIIVQTYEDINKLMMQKQAAALPLGAEPERPKDQGSCIFKTQKSDSELQQRLIEVLEEEEDLSVGAQVDTDTPVIGKKYFKEVFDKFNNKLKYEAGLTSEEDEFDGGNDLEKMNKCYGESEKEEHLHLKN